MMSISIYYSAQRENELCKEEYKTVNSIIEEYNKSYPYRGQENFGFYDFEKLEDYIIFSGSIKLPLTNQVEDTYIGALHWASCLTEIRKVISDAQWDVSIDDVDLSWSETNGWELPQ